MTRYSVVSPGKEGGLGRPYAQSICGKRKAVGECSSAPAAKHQPNLFNRLMGHLKKDTLQNICEDLDVLVSGNKDELISRIAETLR